MKKCSLIIILILFISCKKQIKINSDTLEYIIEFPDTVIVDEKYDGRLFYQSVLDTLTTSFDDDYHRYVFLCMRKTTNIEYSFEELKTKELDTIGADNYREIAIYNISFPTKGVHYIDGIVVDEAIYDISNAENKLPNDSLFRHIVHEFRITKKVVVIDKE
ncbi:hypothetical protein [Myroides odoratus]|uniref:hypothetical protein n=1 Tax=Myroides odoratus TaxID=256 RepID=UPI00055BB76D|nr:hypothetical protein [Myroides odoratus]WQD56414.1 hypothetical protein U0010_12875 [Myroides odoratus]